MSNIYDNEQFFSRYAKMLRSQQGLSAAGEWRQVERLFPDVNGKIVLDLGCGYGWHCKYAVEHGAVQVLGIDSSEKMIQEAESRNPDPKIMYRVSGIEEFEYPEASCDVVVSNLVLHYVADLDAVYRKIYSTLRMDGVFLLNIEHPVFTAGLNQDWIYNAGGKPQYWPVDNYFYPGTRITNFLGQEVLKQHHTLTQILMGLIHTGFRLEAVEEAMPSPEMIHMPGMADEMRRPMMLLVKALKHEVP